MSLTAMESTSISMVTSIKGSGRIISPMAKDRPNIQTVVDTMESSLTIKDTAKVCWLKKEKYSMVISSIIKWMVSEYYSLKTDKDTKVSGLLTKNMATDNIPGQTGVLIKATTRKGKETGRERWSIKMESNTMATGLKAINMEMESTVQVLMSSLANGAKASSKEK